MYFTFRVEIYFSVWHLLFVSTKPNSGKTVFRHAKPNSGRILDPRSVLPGRPWRRSSGHRWFSTDPDQPTQHSTSEVWLFRDPKIKGSCSFRRTGSGTRPEFGSPVVVSIVTSRHWFYRSPEILEEIEPNTTHVSEERVVTVEPSFYTTVSRTSDVRDTLSFRPATMSRYDPRSVRRDNWVDAGH